jgi:hypothetical protein
LPRIKEIVVVVVVVVVAVVEAAVAAVFLVTVFSAQELRRSSGSYLDSLRR